MMQSFFTQLQITKISSFALEAGEIATKSFLAKNFEIRKKSDNSQVTSADIMVSKFLREKLEKEFPQIPIICEEGDLRQISEEIFFLIDPIDGTSSFISGSVEFAINIALIANKKAVFGLIYAPLFEGGKMIFSGEKNHFHQQQPSNLRIITSPRTKDSDIESYLAKFQPNFLKNFSVERLSSAVKFFRLLGGDANLYLHFRPSMEWDTAAGQALVEHSGGKVKTLFFNQNELTIGSNLEYKKPNFSNPAFISFFGNNG